MWTFVIATAAAVLVVAGIEWRAARSPIDIGLSYAESEILADANTARELNGALTAQELSVIKRLARSELERAFSELPVVINDSRHGFWRVRVVPTFVPPRPMNGRGRQVIPAAGASYGFGPLGGGAFLNLNTMIVNAHRYAPPGTPRQAIIHGAGRGLGRAAVHELAHMMLPGVPIDLRTDKNTYDYFSADRASQYYGELHWGGALPLLHQKIGR
jgi:hypothetical protein